ncbi:hypothetical protein [Oenococcus oeni]|uniref:hypothetical protein n=1 Tax=Oenococcus oeni TaxID=1247 RepID=UPI000A73659A|nr:hypothetical protein [Oenococcus oeni]
MNEDKIPETIQDIKERAALMKSRGFSIGEEQVMSQAIKDGLQAIVNDLMDGEIFYRSVNKSEDLYDPWC